MTPDDKKEIFLLIQQKLQQNLEVLVQSAFEAKEASTNEESKAENKYDTRGLEAGYLASGQSKRAGKLQEQIYQLSKLELHKKETISVGSLVTVLVNDQSQAHFFILPAGGVELIYKEKKIQTITFESPLGQSLYGQTVGWDFELKGREYEILEVL
jgi:transcription elongation GreA/GreB family factor